MDLKLDNVHLGLSATETKRKLGSNVKNQVAYVQMKDNFNTSFLENIKFNVKQH